MVIRNAIKVENIGLAQVGHLPRNVASSLAPLLDRRAVTIEGVMKQGNRKLPRFPVICPSLSSFSFWIQGLSVVDVCCHCKLSLHLLPSIP